MNEENHTEGVKTLLGDPKKAIWKLSLPMMAAMLVQAVYNMVDAIWVAGLGSDALAAVGFVFPFFMIAIGFSNGMGSGVTSAIARRIGAGDKRGADNAAEHGVLLAAVMTIAYTVPLLLLSKSIFALMGAGDTLPLTLEYGYVIFAGSVFVFISNTGAGILRAEGDMKKVTYGILAGAIINIFLDPVLIYYFDMGVAGAAYATVASLAVSAAMMIYWLLLRPRGYISLSMGTFKHDIRIMKDILKVGVPASMSQLSSTLSLIMIEFIIIYVANGTTDTIAIFTSGQRILSIAVMPLLGMQVAVLSLAGAQYGGSEYGKLRFTYSYVIRMGIVLETLIAIGIYVFAPQIATLFAYSEGTAHLSSGLVSFLRLTCLFYPSMAVGIMSVSIFEGVGKGLPSLILEIARAIVFTALFSITLIKAFGMGVNGIWIGMVAANIVQSVMSIVWVSRYLKNLKYSFKNATGMQISASRLPD